MFLQHVGSHGLISLYSQHVSQWHLSGPVCAAALGPEGQFLLSLVLHTLTQRICKMAARKLGSLHQGENGHKAANHLSHRFKL
jgi:hypothetical protein